jgi:acyl-CoA synthetase (AMP-forming)/AMP-acid ligase II
MEFNLAEMWEGLVDAGPDAECLVAGDVRHTRRSLDERANRLAHHLWTSGVRPRDMVGVYTYNRAEHVEALLACWKIAAVPININFRYVADELRYVWEDAGLVGLIAERSFVPVINELAPEFPDTSVFVLLEDGTEHIAEFDHVGYETALNAQPGSRNFENERSPDDLYAVYTGGTTGMPKGVIWRHEDVFFGCMGGGNYFDPISNAADILINATDPPLAMNMLASSPLMHGSGQWVTFIALFSGGKAAVYTNRKFDADEILAICQAEDVQNLALVGDAMAVPLIEAMERGNYELPELMSIGNGGAMLSAPTRERIREVFPGRIINDGLGASETGSVGVGIDEGSTVKGARFTIDEQTSVLDPETLEAVAPGEKGMLARTGHIPLGYLNDDVKTAATFKTDAGGTRWVLPGDWALIEPDGALMLLGRGSTTINSGGEKIHPEEVEATCRSHPAVADVIVVGVPDQRWGQRTVALVQLEPGASITLEELQEHCRTQIAGYKVPREIILGPVQRTNVGKADYKWAKAHACEELGIDLA